METDWVSHSDRGSPVTANCLRSFPKAPGTMRGKLGPGDLQETPWRLKTEIVLCKKYTGGMFPMFCQQSFFLAQDLSILSLSSHQKWKSLLNGYQWILGFWGCLSRGNERWSSFKQSLLAAAPCLEKGWSCGAALLPISIVPVGSPQSHRTGQPGRDIPITAGDTW